MIGSLFAGISGLNANSTAMTVIGDNIANVNTTAFKSNSSSFANILSQSLSGSGGNEIGRGVEFWGISPSWSQGSMENTGNATDMAINGNGFFMLRDSGGSVYYTRAGEFHFDKNGNLLNNDGLNVQGYSIGSTGTLGTITSINVPGESTTPPQATTDFTVDINLDADSATGDTYSCIQTFYDSLGNDISLTITFTKTANIREWDWDATIPASAGNVTAGSGTFTFDPDGSLPNGADPTITMTLTNGATTPQTLTWDIYDAGGVTNGDMTQYAAPSTTTFQTQNGYPSGVLRSISVDEAGIVTGAYSNGQLIPLFQVVLADFPSYYGLSKMGRNLYAESLASGQAMPGQPGTGRLGNISPNSIEMSNVDLAQEFVKMITTQRAFQANSRVITTSDEILADLINIKR
ncbi:MAG: flagellar hook protein FlgE [Thermodesulfobacteriota bacterium]|nr:flagellar hook protein FlgE [Thermodesulfobacteriota bacterium]